MTKSQILQKFTVNSKNRIINRGKFENCESFVPYFYALFLSQKHDSYDKDTDVIKFNVQRNDIAEFPELAGTGAVHLWEDKKTNLVYYQDYSN